MAVCAQNFSCQVGEFANSWVIATGLGTSCVIKDGLEGARHIAQLSACRLFPMSLPPTPCQCSWFDIKSKSAASSASCLQRQLPHYRQPRHLVVHAALTRIHQSVAWRRPWLAAQHAISTSDLDSSTSSPRPMIECSPGARAQTIPCARTGHLLLY